MTENQLNLDFTDCVETECTLGTKTTNESVIDETLSVLSLSELKNRHPLSLSGGQKQRLAVAISLLCDKEILIFDEPTNGLDVITAKVVTDFLLELKAEGKTVIVSTHIFSLIEKICDRVGIIINGQMVCCDTLENVTAEKSLEDKFFDIYTEMVGDEA